MNIPNDSKQSGKESTEKNFSLESENDVIKIRKFGRELAKEMGFKSINQTLIAAAISEICRNVIEYAESGIVTFERRENGNPCLAIIVKDEGPGIKNIEEALQEGFSSEKGLGIGLPGTRRLMDVFDIQSAPGKGTTIEMCKYLESDK